MLKKQKLWQTKKNEYKSNPTNKRSRCMIKPNIYFFSPKEKIIPDNIEAFLKSSKIEDIRKILNDFPNLENKILGIRSTSIPMEVLSKITNNEVYKMLIFDTITNLAKGEAISNSFKTSPSLLCYR